MLVTAAQAAYLVERHERIVRWHLSRGDFPRAHKEAGAWQIDTGDLEAIPGWKINRARLAELEERESRTTESLRARLATVEAELAALKARVRALESGQMANTASNALRGESGGLPPQPVSLDVFGASSALVPQPAATSYSLRYSAPTGGGAFRTRADAARWLCLHGVNAETTPKSWSGWRQVQLEPEDVLRLAISVYDPTNWRITWRLHPCADPACVCQNMLA